MPSFPVTIPLGPGPHSLALGLQVFSRGPDVPCSNGAGSCCCVVWTAICPAGQASSELPMLMEWSVLQLPKKNNMGGWPWGSEPCRVMPERRVTVTQLLLLVAQTSPLKPSLLIPFTWPSCALGPVPFWSPPPDHLPGQRCPWVNASRSPSSPPPSTFGKTFLSALDLHHGSSQLLLAVKNLPARWGFDPWVGKIPWRRA